MYYFAQKVAGRSANVDLLIPNGVEPHDWEPTTKDMAKIQNADVFIYNSRYFETWTEKVLKNINQSNLKIVEASKNIELIDADSEEDGNHQIKDHSSKDPHVWLSPVLAKQEVDNIAQALEQKDPKNKEQYEKMPQLLNLNLMIWIAYIKKRLIRREKKNLLHNTLHLATWRNNMD